MNKIRVGILGYGNLGHALEELILQNTNLKLVAIFSKRNNITSIYNTPIIPRDQTLMYKNKIDILAICSGSKTDMLHDASFYVRQFNIINTFDTHNLICKEYKKLDKLSKSNNTLCIMSAGWDPGLFSQIKLQLYNILNTKPNVFWGKGLSLGHSNAAKDISGVIDALSFTIPKKSFMKQAQKGLLINDNNHLRKLYITSEKNFSKNDIKKEILKKHNYFKSEDTTIKFVSLKKLKKLKNFSHAGKIINTKQTSSGQDFRFSFEVKMSSNPHLTAMIMLSYIKSFKNIKNKYKIGTFTPLHFSPLDISDMTDRKSVG